MMSKTYICVLLSGVLLFSATIAYAEATRFFKTAQDIPLMAGLVEDTQNSLSYDSPQGRIIESISILDGVDEHYVRGYYRQALPVFGWQFSSEDQFVRQNETLRMDFVVEDQQKYFLIFIKPR